MSSERKLNKMSREEIEFSVWMLKMSCESFLFRPTWNVRRTLKMSSEGPVVRRSKCQAKLKIISHTLHLVFLSWLSFPHKCQRLSNSPIYPQETSLSLSKLAKSSHAFDLEAEAEPITNVDDEEDEPGAPGDDFNLGDGDDFEPVAPEDDAGLFWIIFFCGMGGGQRIHVFHTFGKSPGNKILFKTEDDFRKVSDGIDNGLTWHNSRNNTVLPYSIRDISVSVAGTEGSKYMKSDARGQQGAGSEKMKTFCDVILHCWFHATTPPMPMVEEWHSHISRVLKFLNVLIYNGTLKCDHLDNLTTLPKRPLFSRPVLV